ncbi:MAG: VUT family protein [Bacillota bacterium]
MLVGLYLCAIIVANLSVAYFGPISTPVVGFLLIGFDLVTRDALHERWQGKSLWVKMLLLISVGGILTWFINQGAGRVAIASVIAFALSGIFDTIVYQLLYRYSKILKVNGSNIVSAAVDSIAFPTIAFGAFIPWVVLGQFAAKVIGGYVWSIIIFRKVKFTNDASSTV